MITNKQALKITAAVASIAILLLALPLRTIWGQEAPNANSQIFLPFLQSAMGQESTTTDAVGADCEIDAFILEHLGIEHCVGAPLSDLFAGEAESGLYEPAEIQAALAGTDPFGNQRANFTQWEHAHVHPLDMTPDGSMLLAVNTAGNSLMLFDVSGASIQQIDTIPVGLDPVSVRARSNTEAWVVNHVSDSVSIVDLTQRTVVATLDTDDEPADIVFAGSPQRAFVSNSQANTVLVFNPTALTAAPQQIQINGEDPRALAVSNDGSQVYAAIFESGNGTAILNGGKRNGRLPNVVDHSDGPYGGQNPPPNDGANFNPPQNPDNPTPPPVALIVRKDEAGNWMDDNNGNWNRFVSGDLATSVGARVAGWDLPDRDVAMIDTSSLNVTYQHRLMNILMAMDVNPVTGELTVVGTDATNEIRFEPNLQGTFLRVNMAQFAPGGNSTIADLNPHLDYNVPRIPQAERNQSIGDPRGIKWNGAGSQAYITGMGSNNVVIIDANGDRVGRIEVGEGPTGIVLQESSNRAFVLNKFDGSISVINLNNNSESTRIAFYDPTPAEIKAGRPHLYDTHASSGLGQISCASCHVDGRTDRLAWDLGNPAGDFEAPFHPMKGPLLTQPLQDIVRSPLLHWRGDKADITEFDGAFESLQGTDSPLSAQDMAELSVLLDSIQIQPNPYRNLDNSLPTAVNVPSPSNDRVGNATGTFNCSNCHLGDAGKAVTISTGTGNSSGGQPVVAGSLRNLYDRMGMFLTDATASNSGFGFLQDGVMGPEIGNTLRNDNNMAFLMAFNGGFEDITTGPASQDTHAAVGRQITVNGSPTAAQSTLLAQLTAMADESAFGIIAKGMLQNEERGFVYLGNGQFQSDRSGETYSQTQLLGFAQSDSPITITAVPWADRIRLGIDHDSDGLLDGDDGNHTQPSSGSALCIDDSRTLQSTDLAHVSIPTLSISGDFTIEAWVQMTAGQTISNRDGIVHDGAGNQDINFFRGRARLFSRNDGGNMVVANSVTQAGVWTHYAFVRQNGALNLYINGQLDSTTNPGWTGDFVINEIAAAVAGNLHGQMDELRIWNVARSQPEIASSHTTEVDSQSGGLLAYYSFNENDGVLRDATGNSFHSTLSQGHTNPLATSAVSNECASISVSTPGDQTNTQYDIVALPVNASGSDGSILSYSATGLPDGLTINRDSGMIEGTLTTLGTFNVTVTVSDGPVSQSVSFNWTIEELIIIGNAVPIYTDTVADGWTQGSWLGVTANPGNNTPVNVGLNSLSVSYDDGSSTLFFNSSAALAASDYQAIRFQLFGTAENQSIDVSILDNSFTNSRVVTVEATPNAWQEFTIPLSGFGTVDDILYILMANPQSTTQPILYLDELVLVDNNEPEPPNNAPSLTNPGNQTNDISESVSLSLNGTDVDGDTLTFTAAALPAGLSLDRTSGIISGVLNRSGTYNVTLTLEDGEGGADSISFNWTVNGIPLPTDADLILEYTLDRSAVPSLYYNELTLNVVTGQADRIVVASDGDVIAHSFDAATGITSFTASGSDIKVYLNGHGSPANFGAIEAAQLKDNKRFAWSIGFDDNTGFIPAIDVLNEFGYRGTVFAITDFIDDTRMESWVVDAPKMRELLALGWAIAPHGLTPSCNDHNIADTSLAFDRIEEIVSQSAVPNYLVTSFAAPCFVADYHPVILQLRNDNTYDVQFNESGDRGLMRIEQGVTTYQSANDGRIAFPLNLSMQPTDEFMQVDRDDPIGRDLRIESDLNGVIETIDWMANNAADDNVFWLNMFQHASDGVDLRTLLTHMQSNYGDDVLVAPSDEIYSYLLVRDLTIIEGGPDGGTGGGTIACTAPANVAPAGTASHSSGWFGDRFPASRALDGNLGNFSHTARGQSPASWQVELNSEHVIREIVLHNRNHAAAAARLRDITVSVLDGAGNSVFESALLNPENSLNSPAQLTVSLPDGVTGQTVRVVRTPDPDLSGSNGVGNVDEPDVLSLGEVEVMACQP